MSDDMSHDDKGEAPLFFKIPIDWSNMQLTEAVRALRLPRDPANLLKGQPVVIMGPNPSNTYLNIAEVGSFADDLANGSDTGLLVKAMQYILGSSSHLERVRAVTTYKSATDLTTTGTVWTPAGGKKYRLMGGIITIAELTACAGACNIYLNDSGGGLIMPFRLSHAALTALPNMVVIPIVLPANGYLSPTADNTLSLAFSAALTAGSVDIAVWGTEE